MYVYVKIYVYIYIYVCVHIYSCVQYICMVNTGPKTGCSSSDGPPPRGSRVHPLQKGHAHIPHNRRFSRFGRKTSRSFFKSPVWRDRVSFWRSS